MYGSWQHKTGNVLIERRPGVKVLGELDEGCGACSSDGAGGCSGSDGCGTCSGCSFSYVG